VLIAVDTDDVAALDRARSIAGEVGVPVRLVPAFDLDAGQSFNVLAGQARGEFVLFLWAGSTIRPLALRALTKVAASSNADLVNYFFRVTHQGEAAAKDYLSAIVFGNVAQSFFRGDVTSLPLLVRRRTFARLEGFTTDYRVLAHDHELVAKAQISGVHCETALLELGAVPAWNEEWLKAKCYDQGVAQFRAIRPELAAAPLALRELLLMAKGLQKGGVRRGKGQAKGRPRSAAAEKEGPLGRLLTVLSSDLMASEGAPPERAKTELPGSRQRAGNDVQSAPGPVRNDTNPPRPLPPQPAAGVESVILAAVASGKDVPPLEPRDVARAARLDVKAARAGGLRGAGLVQLLDELSADTHEEEVKAPKAPEVRRARVSDPRPPVKRPAGRPITAAYMLSNLAGRRYSGRLLGVHDGVAYGWVRNEDDPLQPVEIEFVNGRGSSRTLHAGSEIPTVLPLPAEIRKHGFAVPLWAGWQPLHRFRKAKHLEIRIKGTDVQVAALAAHPDAARLSRAGFEGYCDLVDATVRGWVWQPSNPDQPIDVAVYVDDKFMARATAEDLREDLRAAQIGNAAYGFSVALPAQLRNGTPHRVDVVVADAGVLLNNGRLRLVGNTLSLLD